ncbi:MAG: DUF86 domain-containing protein [Candidatus Magnetominusculus sp. LBB02]|nr:DUF86 domain-containing protein [Candidatus Magnetominusculus sp. LBB02]
MSRDTLIYIKDIYQHILKIEEFAGDSTQEEFINDEKTYYAVIRCIEIIGEASKHVSNNVRSKYPVIPWRDMSGMRNKVIHAYFGINPQMVWMVVKNDISQLKPLIEVALVDLQKQMP